MRPRSPSDSLALEFPSKLLLSLGLFSLGLLGLAVAACSPAASSAERAPVASDPPPGPPPGEAPAGMVWIPPGTFTMGDVGPLAYPDEGPLNAVRLDGFWMDASEVTVAEFRRFVEATGYVTTAEVAPDVDEILAQLPPGTPAPDPSLLVPGGLVFRPLDPGSGGSWWEWRPGTNWRFPRGPEEAPAEDDHPVTQVSWFDAAAYAEWAGKRLPTEAEWEYAARGGAEQRPFVWGTEREPDGEPLANLWDGRFPVSDLARDGFQGTGPVRAFAPNGYGLYDMAGNVWEWCSGLVSRRTRTGTRTGTRRGGGGGQGRPIPPRISIPPNRRSRSAWSAAGRSSAATTTAWATGPAPA